MHRESRSSQGDPAQLELECLSHEYSPITAYSVSGGYKRHSLLCAPLALEIQVSSQQNRIPTGHVRGHRAEITSAFLYLDIYSL